MRASTRPPSLPLRMCSALSVIGLVSNEVQRSSHSSHRSLPAIRCRCRLLQSHALPSEAGLSVKAGTSRRVGT